LLFITAQQIALPLGGLTQQTFILQCLMITDFAGYLCLKFSHMQQTGAASWGWVFI